MGTNASKDQPTELLGEKKEPLFVYVIAMWVSTSSSLRPS